MKVTDITYNVGMCLRASGSIFNTGPLYGGDGPQFLVLVLVFRDSENAPTRPPAALYGNILPPSVLDGCWYSRLRTQHFSLLCVVQYTAQCRCR
jgi:hypothetical protein